jgi:hypothetical protein
VAGEESALEVQRLREDLAGSKAENKELKKELSAAQAKADPLVAQGAALFPTNVDVLRDVVNYFAIQNRVPMAIEYGKKLERLVPEDAEVKLGMPKAI